MSEKNSTGGEDTGRSGDDLTNLDDPDIRWQKTALRCRYIERCFIALSSRWTARIGVPFHISEIFLLSAVQSYIHDVRRLKEFHDIKVADRYKVASYTMRWLSKTRPVYVRNEDLKTPVSKKDVVCLMPNAGFAFTVGCDMAEVDSKKFDRKFVAQVLYDLHYRDVEPGMTAQLMELLAHRWPKN